MKLSATCSCALRALVFQARQSAGRFVPADAIAEAEGLSARWVRKALEPLVPAGLLLSAGKLGGGQCLARRARTITLREVVEGVEGPVGGVVPRWTTEAAGVRLDGRFCGRVPRGGRGGAGAVPGSHQCRPGV
jgi:DNA-binding IscR family transcriptional regulator